jgi:hypothetical protein
MSALQMIIIHLILRISSAVVKTQIPHAPTLGPMTHGSLVTVKPIAQVERPTTHIISYLQQTEEARREFNLRGGIIFESYANTLSNSNEEVQQSPQDLCILSKGHASSSNLKPRNAY